MGRGEGVWGDARGMVEGWVGVRVGWVYGVGQEGGDEGRVGRDWGWRVLKAWVGVGTGWGYGIGMWVRG